jgi:hypothetical protein
VRLLLDPLLVCFFFFLINLFLISFDGEWEGSYPACRHRVSNRDIFCLEGMNLGCMKEINKKKEDDDERGEGRGDIYWH